MSKERNGMETEELKKVQTEGAEIKEEDLDIVAGGLFDAPLYVKPWQSGKGPVI